MCSGTLHPAQPAALFLQAVSCFLQSDRRRKALSLFVSDHKTVFCFQYAPAPSMLPGLTAADSSHETAAAPVCRLQCGSGEIAFFRMPAEETAGSAADLSESHSPETGKSNGLRTGSSPFCCRRVQLRLSFHAAGAGGHELRLLILQRFFRSPIIRVQVRLCRSAAGSWLQDISSAAMARRPCNGSPAQYGPDRSR